MISFEIKNNLLILIYDADRGFSNEWVHTRLEEDEKTKLHRIFTFSKNDIYKEDNLSNDLTEDREAPIKFIMARLDGEYFKINGTILSIDFSVFIHKLIDVKLNFFEAVKKVSVFKKISQLVNRDIYIGGEGPEALPIEEFYKLIKTFPNSYELSKYADARLSAILRDYFDNMIDGEKLYNQYINKKHDLSKENLFDIFKDNELEKYKIILDKLNEMLANEDSYSEKQWQKAILEIMLLLYPKYIHVFEATLVPDEYSRKKRQLDYLLVDSDGNIDITEIKKPFDKCIVTKGQYRDNFIPLRELSGTVMQIEKYIFYLNKWGKQGEEKLTLKYHEKISSNFNIKITNPSGIIIMGRDNNLSPEQKQDFEIIKRKYKNIIDIITYDDLIRRLNSVISQLSVPGSVIS